jgi:hypothetical protein
MATDRERAMTEGSPALATLILALGAAVAGRTLMGRIVLTRMIRRRGRYDAD